MSTTCVSRKFENAQEAFEYLFKYIKKYGKMKEEADDKKSTKYLRNVSFTIRHPKDRMIKTPWRKWNKNYAEREWQWYLSKDRSVEELKKHAPLWDTMHGGDNIVNSNLKFTSNKLIISIISPKIIILKIYSIFNIICMYQ